MEAEVTLEAMRAFARDMSKLSSIVTSAAVLAAAARKDVSWLKRSSCVPVVSSVKLKSESRALGLDDEASIDGRIRGGLLPAEDEAGAGDKGVEAFFVSPCDNSRPLPGEEELMRTGRRKGESRLKFREAAESEDPTLEGERFGELFGELDDLRKSDSAVGAASRATCFEGDERMLLLPLDVFRGDLDGDVGGGIWIESNMAASAAFSGDIGFDSGKV